MRRRCGVCAGRDSEVGPLQAFCHDLARVNKDSQDSHNHWRASRYKPPSTWSARATGEPAATDLNGPELCRDASRSWRQEVEEFVTGRRPERKRPERVLAIVLSTDIVDSTATAQQRLGIPCNAAVTRTMLRAVPIAWMRESGHLTWMLRRTRVSFPSASAMVSLPWSLRVLSLPIERERLDVAVAALLRASAEFSSIAGRVIVSLSARTTWPIRTCSAVPPTVIVTGSPRDTRTPRISFDRRVAKRNPAGRAIVTEAILGASTPARMVQASFGLRTGSPVRASPERRAIRARGAIPLI